MSARELVYARLTELVDEPLLHDPLVRAESPDAVHRMRIASRRLRSNLATYRPVLDRAATDPVRDELRWLGQVLGCARDSEVQAVHLERALDELDPELVRGPVRARLPAHASPLPHAARRTRERSVEPGVDERGSPTLFHDLTVIGGGVGAF